MQYLIIGKTESDCILLLEFRQLDLSYLWREDLNFKIGIETKVLHRKHIWIISPLILYSYYFHARNFEFYL